MLDNLIVCVLSDGFTAIERTMMEGGEPDLTIEIFLMDGPLVGFGALELVDPPSSNPGTGDN
ncbi:MAG: hypothetical protein WB761_00425 [Solirubrobacteraceae bacterium]